MSTAASVADWLRAGGIGVGAWAVIAVLVKVAVDGPSTSPAAPSNAEPEPERPASTVQPRPIYPPSTGRHAAGPATASTSPSRVQPHLARHSRRPVSSWT